VELGFLPARSVRLPFGGVLTSHTHDWKTLPRQAVVYSGVVITVGTAILVYAALHPFNRDSAQFFCYLLIAVLASRLKTNLPEATGTVPAEFLFILLGILELSFAETLALGCFTVLLHSPKRSRRRALQITFRVCLNAIAVVATYVAFQFTQNHWQLDNATLPLLVAAVMYFVVQTAASAVGTALRVWKSFWEVWRGYFWSLPYHLVGAAIALGIRWCNRLYHWQSSLLLLPAMYVLYWSYRLYLGKLESEKRHMDEMADLHLRTIEALALAIEAKDHTTHDHLQRVRVYAMEVAKQLKVSPEEQEALNAAALLHDIGKLAIPEHIISKPGRLTPEEFEKMKIHPVVGAEILERVRFPYPVVPIVRAHHEKWDGSGYPYGLKGENIPIGARILSAVDFLDAMASDRQYRRALPLDEVIKRMGSESGKSFDPRVVAVLEKRYRDLERIVHGSTDTETGSKLSTEAKIERGSAPAAGFENSGVRIPQGPETNFLASIAAARQEAQTLFELSQELGSSLSLDETLSVFSVKLRRLVPFDSIAVYVRKGEELMPVHVSGENFRLFSSLRIPMGQGLSGWVAQNGKPIINGNPSVEPGYMNDISKYSTLRSALAIPLDGLTGVVGVLALYHADRDAFTSDHLRVLQAVSSKMALAIENALKYEQAESSATTDYLTGLPNARSLFLELDRELARCKRDGSPLTVMVCDLNGFKQINDRFGHLEGNRILRLFAMAVKDSCRDYDHVARMGGDEFVIVAPGLHPDAIRKKINTLGELARMAGREVCSEDILSLCVGQASYPGDGEDAEKLLAEADRRMYLEKAQRPEQRNRRLYPRMKCRTTIEFLAAGSTAQALGSLSDISLGGCYLETTAVLPAGTKIQIGFSIGGGDLLVEGTVIRFDPGFGVAMQFNELPRLERDRMLKVLEFVHNTSAQRDNFYVKTLRNATFK
jgi:diguanylate cyclase (GGDEF)-like protein/putative nucleotidyltransferase with HDIG domain